MPKVAIDYTGTIIYKFVCKDLNIKDVYIGHTTNFTERKYQHKSRCNNINGPKYNFNVYRIIRENGGWDNWEMIEIEQYSCQDQNEAIARERYWYELNHSTLNSTKPNRTPEEYINDNIEHVKLRRKHYHSTNKDIINQAQKEYYIKNRAIALENRKTYYKNNKETIIEKNKEYYIKNIEKKREYLKSYNEKNKEAISKKAKEKYQNNKEAIEEKAKEKYQNNKKAIAEKRKITKCDCECGSCVRKSDYQKHLRTKKHLDFMNSKN